MPLRGQLHSPLSTLLTLSSRQPGNLSVGRLGAVVQADLAVKLAGESGVPRIPFYFQWIANAIFPRIIGDGIFQCCGRYSRGSAA